jgi:tRNA-binding protein
MSPTEALPPVTFDEFAAVDIRAGRITRAEPFAKARKPSYKLWIDFGEPLGELKSSAQITAHYRVDDLVGRHILAVVNFPPRQIADFMSQVLVLGVPDAAGEVVLVAPDIETPLGSRLF